MSELMQGILRKETGTSKRKSSWLAGQYRSQTSGVVKIRRGADITQLIMRSCDSTNDTSWATEELEELFSELTYLDFANTPIHTKLIEYFSNCPKLQHCNFSNCNLQALPVTFTQLSLLKIINLSMNSFDSVPEELYSLENLEELDLSQNNISHVPAELEAFRNLSSLNVSGNPISAFPTVIRSIMSLKEFICWNTEISELPRQLFRTSHAVFGSAASHKITKLDLHANKISHIPSEWLIALTELKYLDLSCNCIKYLPESIGYLHSLTYLNLRRNELILIPPSLSRLHKQLKYVYFSQNKFQTPPSTFTGTTLSYFSGILPGQFYDTWILQCISRSLTFRQWTSPELIIIGESVSGDLLRRHVQKAVSEVGENVSPASVKFILLNSQDRRVVLAALEDLSTSYCSEIYTEGGCHLIAQKILSHDEEISTSSTKVLANLCIINEEAAIEILTNGSYAEHFIQSVTDLIRQGNIDYLRCFLSLCRNGKAKFYRTILPEEIEYGKLLGQGATGLVYKGRWNGVEVAVKKFNTDFLNKEEFRTEITVMSILDHPSIIQCYGGCEKKKDYLIVCKYYPCGNLGELLHGQDPELIEMMEARTKEIYLAPTAPRDELNFHNRLQIVINIARAMRYLHDMNIIHRDLKAENILIDADLNICIADFGIACLRSKRTSKAMGTPRYMAPELLEGHSYDEKVDVFSFGVLCWEILARAIPYDEEGFSAWELSEKVVSGYRPPILPEWPSVVSRIMLTCWASEPGKRPTMKTVCNSMTRFEGLNIEELQKMKETTSSAHSRFSNGGIVSKEAHSSVLKEAAQAAQAKKSTTGTSSGWRSRRKGKSRNYSILSPRRFGAKLKPSPATSSSPSTPASPPKNSEFPIGSL